MEQHAKGGLMFDFKLEIKFQDITVDFSSIVDVLKEKLKRLSGLATKETPFSNISEAKLSMALVNAINLLLNDRLTDGLGRGGWGHSEKIHAREFFGEKAANRTEDSVMASVNTILALRACISLLRQSKSPKVLDLLSKIANIVYKDFDGYIGRRWNKKYGYGGILKYGRENEGNILTSYRHTAWLLLLWLEDMRYARNIEITYQYLVDNFEVTNWKRESVFTDFATYSALKSVLDYNQQSKSLNVERVPMFFSSLEASILSKYVFELNGWTFEDQKTEENKNRWLAARQPYTLCVLTEMAHHFDKTNGLAHSMKRALDETIKGDWKACNGKYGIPKLPNGDPDIILSSLGASVLLRKSNKSLEEMLYLQEIVDFVVTSLAENRGSVNESYLWPLSYFVRDTCNYLNKPELF